jgi:hypothetical protein
VSTLERFWWLAIGYTGVLGTIVNIREGTDWWAAIAATGAVVSFSNAGLFKGDGR